MKTKKKTVKKQNSKSSYWSWPIKVFFLALALSLFFSISSEFILSSAGIVVSILIILFLIALAVFTDMIGVAVTACHIEPFRAMASRKVRGAKESLLLLRNADKVASLCADVIGDVCGILSGAAGATIIVKVVSTNASNAVQILVAASISSLIAGLTIFGKALGKKISINKSQNIVHGVGKFLSLFTRQDKKKKIEAENECNCVETKETKKEELKK